MNKEALSRLDGFTGTEQYHPFYPRLFLTDGTKFLCENADCYWIGDIINSYLSMTVRDESLRGIQFWSVRKGPAPTKKELLAKGNRLLSYTKCPEGKPACHVICERDTDDVAIVQEIPFTDFPFEAFGPEGCRVYVGQLDSVRYTMYLPSEH